ncbi:uncharacterized protein EDB91DRAFT_1347607 [Suillus paluster]|uniref:uncharacterized protein n=1 Tax=Suillus paluster TaxID=48578 RepID=UPI001B86DB09|nr:uncharacterized protein EDB91DRAFT_1347607 [Suillus paluster]KAG1738336.1 hypothetical protein EDB91DRAFT_1347607 [Suillus paluster]
MSRSNLDCGSTVAASAIMVYDWALTFGQEVELVWVSRVPSPSPSKEEEDDTIFGTDATLVPHDGYVSHYALCWDTITPCDIKYSAMSWTNVITAVMLDVIMIARLHAMYQGSRKMLIFLIVSFLAVNIACIVITAIVLQYVASEEYVLSGAHTCYYTLWGDTVFLIQMTWILTLIWEVLALCLAVWIAVKHFCGLTIGDVFTVLMKSHVLYFASFAAVAALQLGGFSPIINSDSVGVVIYDAFLQVFSVVQMFMLGPRLILSVREVHAKLVAVSDTATDMASIVFEERVHVSTNNSV